MCDEPARRARFNTASPTLHTPPHRQGRGGSERGVRQRTVEVGGGRRGTAAVRRRQSSSQATTHPARQIPILHWTAR